ncbi:MAG: hypothetical protein Q4G14_02755 [Paracoccus sp. (in: a-proteobacteria)]|uniref:hypothetical protein n=1 Tax=Paracoccus sp. TaxID=267 RepID=UPI0026E10C69|nr:hypothetical protein [Paracoccus sp. (in: a-proteobacteria)]MDO5612145.1 hypothetical protein [Paracoccus sp. (in: a-proteobacteria)]
MVVAAGAASAGPVRFSVSDQAVAPAARGVTVTIDSVGEGSSFFPGGDFEPIIHRDWLYASDDSPDDQPGQIVVGAQDVSRWDVLRDGALDGADVQVLRIENGQFREVRSGTLAPGGHAVSGWFPLTTGIVSLHPGLTRATVRINDWERPGVPRWFTVRAYDNRGRLSDYAVPARVEVPQELQQQAKRDDADRPSQPPPSVDDPSADADPRGPLAPQGVTAQMAPGAVVNLNWELPADDDDIVGVVIYQSYVAPEQMRGFGLTMTDATSGEPVRRGDLIVLRKVIDQPDRTKLLSDRVWTAGVASGWLRRMMPDFNDMPGDASWSYRPHDPDPARAWGGRSYLHVELPGRTRFSFGVHNHAGTEQNWYEVLRPGVEYTVSARLRGQRAGSARFRLLGTDYQDLPALSLDYGTEWANVSATFTVPEVLTGARPIGQMVLAFQGPGWVDVDDVRVHRSDTPFLALNADESAALRDAGVSALRFHGMVRTGTDTYDLPALLRRGGFRLKSRQMAGMPDSLGWAQDAAADPWLQIEPHLSDEEWRGLIEYLAAPFDPATDDPADKPWAALRVAQGQAAPWTDQFDRLYFEVGNETWNPIFRPWVFRGMTDAATGTDYDNGQVYGLFQARIAQILRSSPWWDAAGLEDKLVFVIGGRAGFDFTTSAASTAGPADAADLLTIAAYNGGWDENEGPPRRNRASFVNLLNQVLQVVPQRIEQMSGGAETLAARTGHRPLIGTYEAGPGYVMNGLNGARLSGEQQQEQEQVMKSRAAGVATLDTFLMQRQLGMTVQNFFTFGPGEYWRSHQQWYNGGEPYPAWSLLAAMNRHGAGEMLAVTASGDMPTQRLHKAERRAAVRRAPQVAVYAARQDDRLTVFALSRQVPDTPDGRDACTPVEVAVPVTRAQSLRLIRTGGAYDDNFTTGPAPVIEDVALDPALIRDGLLRIGGADSGAPDCGLPGASAYIYVIEGAAP